MIKRYIRVKTETEFIHQYLGAPEEVSYLANPHRHMLHIMVTIEVSTDDRELEFIMVKHSLDKCLETLHLTTVSNRSCEMIAQDILAFLKIAYGTQRSIQIEVSEDGENGAVLSYLKED